MFAQIDRVKYWCDEWLLPLNINKYCAVSITPRVKLDATYCIKNKDDGHNTHNVGCVIDLQGILFDTQLNFTDHSQEKIKKADRIIGLL